MQQHVVIEVRCLNANHICTSCCLLNERWIVNALQLYHVVLQLFMFSHTWHEDKILHLPLLVQSFILDARHRRVHDATHLLLYVQPFHLGLLEHHVHSEGFRDESGATDCSIARIYHKRRGSHSSLYV